jgi:transposase-like protein
MNPLKNVIFRDDTKAREWLEAMLWPEGPVCPFCGSVDQATALETRPGLYQCNEGECRKQFTVTVGTLFERSHIPLSKWLMAAFLLCASKKGISAHQMHRMIGVSYKSTWFMMHRLREAMKEGNPEPMGRSGPIQADETYFGPVANPRTKTVKGRPFTKGGKSGPSNKRAIVALLSGGKARTFHVACADAKTVREILVTNTKREAELHTDESRLYMTIGKEFAAHRTVNHKAGEYVGKAGETINASANQTP